jgi:WD40 repeat protein
MGAGDGVARILDAEGRLISARPPEPRPIVAARFSPGGDRFAYALADGTLRVCDREGAEIAAARCGGEPKALAFPAEGDRLLVACGLPNIQLFNPQDGSLTATLTGSPRPIVTVDSSAQGRIVTGDDQGRMVIWENDQPLRTLSLRNGGTVAQTRISPDGRWLVAIDSGRCVSLVSMDHQSELLYLEPGDDAAWLSWNSDSTNVAVCSFGGQLRIWTTAGKRIAEARLPRMPVKTVCWLPGKSTLWLGLDDSTVHVWELNGQRFERTILLLAGGPTAVLTSSGRILAAPPSFQDDVAYGLETSDGSLELLRPQEFHQRHQLPWPPP